MSDYADFLRQKIKMAQFKGYTMDAGDIHPILYPHQKDIVRWAVQGGNRAIFAKFGLGKSVMQCEWIRQIIGAAGGDGLVICPLGVRQELIRDAAMVDVELRFIRTMAEITPDHHFYITNYESARDGKLDPAHFTAGGEQARPGTAITQGIVTASMIHMGHGEGKNGGKRFSSGIRSVTEPVNTITASGAVGALVTSNMIKLRGTNVGSGTDEPIHTISAQGTHHAEVRAFLIKYYSEGGQDQSCADPMHTIPTKDRLGLVTVHGEEYAIVDIGLRMLTPRELYRAQGFPENYRIDVGTDGKSMTKTAQVRMCGNSVSPPCAFSITKANYQEQITQRMVA